MPVQTKISLFELIRAHQNAIRAAGVRRIGLFGSFVRGEQSPGSDIDLLVEFEPGRKTFDNFMHVSFLLEELFERRIELVTLESVSPYIRPTILREVEYVNVGA